MSPANEHEPRLKELIEWAREFLATEVPGQYTSDAALQLALAAWLDERSETKATLPGRPVEPAEELTAVRKPGGYLP